MLSKYGVARHIYIPVVKRAVVDFAISTDWTPAAGDVKISKDGGAFNNVTNLPVAINSANTGAVWDFSLTATEMQAAQVTVVISDASTKAIEDQSFIIETYGNVSGQHEFDLDTPTVVASSVSALAANVITAASINAGAITNAKFAAGAIDANAIAAGAIAAAKIAADTGLIIRAGTAQAGAATAITLDAGASATNNTYLGSVVVITGGTGAGQHRVIAAYVGATKVATVSVWATNPDNTSTFVILPARAFVDAVATDAIDANAVATGAIDANSIAANAITSAGLDASAVTEIRDAIWQQTMTELVAVPGVTANLMQAIEWIFLQHRNKITQTATVTSLRNDADGANIAQAGVTDDGVTFTRGEWT